MTMKQDSLSAARIVAVTLFWIAQLSIKGKTD